MAFSAGKVPNFFEGASETPTFFQEIDIPFKEIAGDTGRIGGPTSRSSANMATIQPEVENGDSVVKLPSFMTFVNSVKRGFPTNQDPSQIALLDYVAERSSRTSTTAVSNPDQTRSTILPIRAVTTEFLQEAMTGRRLLQLDPSSIRISRNLRLPHAIPLLRPDPLLSAKYLCLNGGLQPLTGILDAHQIRQQMQVAEHPSLRETEPPGRNWLVLVNPNRMSVLISKHVRGQCVMHSIKKTGMRKRKTIREGEGAESVAKGAVAQHPTSS